MRRPYAAGARAQRPGDPVDQRLRGEVLGGADPVGDDDEGHPCPVRVVGHAREAVHPGERPGLGAHPSAGLGRALLEAVRQRPGEAGHREAGEHLAQLRVLCAGGESYDGGEALGREQVLAGEPAAVVQHVAGDGYAEPLEHLENGRRPGLERALLPLGEADLAGQHLGGLVVADRQRALDDLAERCARDRRDLRAAGGCADAAYVRTDAGCRRHRERCGTSPRRPLPGRRRSRSRRSRAPRRPRAR